MRSVILAILILLPAAARADREAARESYQQGNESFDQSRFTDAAATYERAERTPHPPLCGSPSPLGEGKHVFGALVR